MPTYDQLNYEPLLKDKRTRSEIMRAKRHAAHRASTPLPLRIKLYSTQDESAEALNATAVLSRNGVYLDVPFMMPDGTHGFRAYDYQELAAKCAHII